MDEMRTPMRPSKSFSEGQADIVGYVVQGRTGRERRRSCMVPSKV
jgi:hypothetical protein